MSVTHKYKAIVTDLDGTAIRMSSDGSDIPEDTRQAVRHALDLGYKITCASGRLWVLAKPAVGHLGLRGPCIIEGGSSIIDSVTEKILWQKYIEDTEAQAVFQIFKNKMANEGGAFVHSADLIPRGLEAFDSIPQGLRFLYLLGIPEKSAKQAAALINSQTGAIAHLTPSWDGPGLFDVHVTHPEATKEHAIRVWQQMAGVTKAQTIGMGDSSNDLPIFQAAGLKIAVETATPDLKPLADHLAPGPEDGALKYVIDTFLLKKSSLKTVLE